MPKDNNIDTASAPPTSGYSTRKKQYKYSHTKAPYTPAPARNPTRPPLPPLASRMKPAGNATNHQSSDSAKSTGDKGDSHDGCNVTPFRPALSSMTPVDPGTNSSMTPQNSQPLPLTNSYKPSVHTLTGIPEGQESPSSPIRENVQITSENNPTGVVTAAGEPRASTRSMAGFGLPITSVMSNNSTSITFSTPRRPTQKNTGYKTPTVLIFGPPPNWALDFGNGEASETGPYASIAPVSEETTQATNSTPSISGDIPNPPSPPSDPFRDDLGSVQGNEPGLPLPVSSVSGVANASIWSPPTTYGDTHSVTSFASLRDAVFQSMPPLPASSMILTTVSSPARTIASPARAITFPTHNITPSSALVRASTPAAVSAQARPTPSMHMPPPNNPPSSGSHRESADPQLTLRQSHFTYDQVASIKMMSKRWAYYLVTEDCFPANTIAAQEACIKYAENALGISRRTAQFTRPMWDFVRKKESRVRNDFQKGVVRTVENDYAVTGKTEEGKAKIAELLSDCNFIFTQYDVNNRSSVTGRYRHPCIVSVIKILLFTRTSRGQPVGARFIRELMSDTPVHLVRQFEDQTATSGAPVPLLALACTIILHALHSLQAGDSSTRPVNMKKPINFTEQNYNVHYQTFLENLKGYRRLGKLRIFHMEHIMKEYLQLRPGGDPQTLELPLDDGTEWFSDDDSE